MSSGSSIVNITMAKTSPITIKVGAMEDMAIQALWRELNPIS